MYEEPLLVGGSEVYNNFSNFDDSQVNLKSFVFVGLSEQLHVLKYYFKFFWKINEFENIFSRFEICLTAVPR